MSTTHEHRWSILFHLCHEAYMKYLRTEAICLAKNTGSPEWVQVLYNAVPLSAI